jgi:hypothetical protein
MPKGSDWTALVGLRETDRQRALEQFYWLRAALEDGVPLQPVSFVRGPNGRSGVAPSDVGAVWLVATARLVEIAGTGVAVAAGRG